MTGSKHKATTRAVLLAGVMIFGLLGGCAPKSFGPAVRYYAQQAAVTDAAARYAGGSPYYRFDTALLSDLDDAIEQTDELAKRRAAAAVLRGASRLGQASSANEIARMPIKARTALARLAGTTSSPAALRRHFQWLADPALKQDLRETVELGIKRLQRKLRAIRKSVEVLPDDRGRLARRFMLSWAELLTSNGIAREESKLAKKTLAKAKKTFTRVVVWRPGLLNGSPLLRRYAPAIGMEWPEISHYNSNWNRLGAVELSKKPTGIDVRIDTAKPTVYAYTTIAKIGAVRLQQLNYVWWFPQRPALSPNDPVAGHVDGAMLRITLDTHQEPLFVESSLNCGCSHEVFVSEAVESAARIAFGPPLPGKRFAVEKHGPGKHDVIVVATFHDQPNAAHPLVLSAAGYHEVCQVYFPDPAAIPSLQIIEDGSYRLHDYSVLDRLPLGNGQGSMFGPDGLVHNAGRREGFLLAPSGMLSAGQPRKRGTQRIRWDDYLHDDPRLLEKTLRLPPLD